MSKVQIGFFVRIDEFDEDSSVAVVVKVEMVRPRDPFVVVDENNTCRN